MMELTEGNVRRAVTRFEKAADAYAFRGTIPRLESDEAFLEYRRVENEYAKAKQAILDVMIFAVRQL